MSELRDEIRNLSAVLELLQTEARRRDGGLPCTPVRPHPVRAVHLWRGGAIPGAMPCASPRRNGNGRKFCSICRTTCASSGCVLHAYGGQDLRVPRQEPKRDSPLRRRLGLRCLRKLMAAFGGTRVYVPRCNALLGKLRQREIIEGFSRHTGHGLSSTAAVAALAQRHDMSDRRIWQLLKKEASAPAVCFTAWAIPRPWPKPGADAQGAAVALTALKIPGRMEPMPTARARH